MKTRNDLKKRKEFSHKARAKKSPLEHWGPASWEEFEESIRTKLQSAEASKARKGAA